MNIVFLGNHTVGVRTLATILETERVTGVVAHPPDSEDGWRYQSVFDYAESRGLNARRLAGRDPALLEFIRQAQPDLLWITDYRYLIPAEVVALAPLGAVNLHPSLLPKHRGRASINWAIINGETTLGLTAHFVDAGMDTGDIIEQASYQLTEEQDVGDALNILYPVYEQLTRRTLSHFRSGQIPRLPQDHSHATAYPRRRPEDGRIDWAQPARRVRDLVRAVARPYPGAFTFCQGRKLMVWKAALAPDAAGGPPGRVLAGTMEGIRVAAGEGAVLLREIQWADTGEPAALEVGSQLD